MKTVTLLIFLLTAKLTWGQISENKKCIIKPGIGLNNITIDKSTLNDVKNAFGQNKIKTQKVKGCGTFGDSDCGSASFLIYRSKGITFSTHPKNTDSIVKNINLEKKCDCKTDKGIGIGSTKKELINKYGLTKDSTLVDRIGLYYFYEGITFILEPTKTENSKVTSITIESSD